MKRPLAVLAAAVLTVAGVTVPAVDAALADGAVPITVTNVATSWHNDVLTVSYDYAIPTDDDPGTTGGIDIVVGQGDHGPFSHQSVDRPSGSFTYRSIEPASDGSVPVLINVSTCTPDNTCTGTRAYTGTVTASRSPGPHGTVSAVVLLDELDPKSESHASSYGRSKFKLWIDANHDGENTRAEVLKAESMNKVAENTRHTVKTGRWTSKYDGTTFTVASKLDIDHLVPLEEAWTSGAWNWSTKKRTAYANDLGYAASLIAVSKHANRSKGDHEPNAYLPPARGYRCTYVRNWIAVKYRWGLTVDYPEYTALSHDLLTYCTNFWVTKPGTPNLTQLAG